MNYNNNNFPSIINMNNIIQPIPIIPINIQTNNTNNNLQSELLQKTKQIQLIQNAYWSLKSDFDNAINIIQSLKEQAENNNTNNTNKLSTINEEENAELIKLREKNKELENIISNNQNEIIELKNKNNNFQNNTSILKKKIKKLERQNRKLSNFNTISEHKTTIRNNTLNSLYLNSNRIKEFMQNIKKFGIEFETLKKRQNNLISTIDNEDSETIKIRMTDLYSDICDIESIYNTLYNSLDILKTESQGKELDLITKDKEYILLLEKEKFIQSSHLEEYVKKNQTLQTNLTDREMKLRQSQNQVKFIKQKLNHMQIQYDQLNQTLNNNYYYSF